jgi:hypothetical protein
MNKKSLLFGLLAAVTAVFIITGCNNGTTEPEIRWRDPQRLPGEMIHVDAAFNNESDLGDALDSPAYNGKVIGISGPITLVSALEIPSGYTVYILNGGGLNTGSSAGLEINGALWVGMGGVLGADVSGSSADPITVDGGVINVVTGGQLSIDSEDSVIDGDGDPVLGTSKISIVNGTLAYTADGDFSDTGDIQDALGYITSGTLNVDLSSSLKPSDLQTLSIPAGKYVEADTGITGETEASLTIPAGLYLTTGANLGVVDELTVNGTLTASSATLKSAGGAFTVNAGGELTLGAATLLTSSVDAGGVLTLSGDLTLDTGAVLTIANPGRVSGTDKIIAAAGTITIGTGNDAFEGFTTTGTGVTAGDLEDILEALKADGLLLTAAGNKAAPTSGSAIGVTNTLDAPISLSSGTAIAVGTGTATGSSNASVSVGDVSLSLNVAALELTDSSCAGSAADVESLITFDSLKLQNSELISPAMPAGTVTIALTTDR